ncbi:MAG: hypothetical protein QME12_07375 [Nanoarchaeota archaeon]|nr:hypothetical protein [Nanoarchaeota archaeon]
MVNESIDEELRVKLDGAIKKCSIGDKKEKEFEECVLKEVLG